MRWHCYSFHPWLPLQNMVTQQARIHVSLVQWATLILWMKKRSLLISMKNPHPALECSRRLQRPSSNKQPHYKTTSFQSQDNALHRNLSLALWGQRTHKGGLSLKTFDHAQQLKTPHHHELLFSRFVGLHLVPQLPLLWRTGTELIPNCQQSLPPSQLYYGMIEYWDCWEPRR